MKIATLQDVEEIERTPLQYQRIPNSTYEMILRGAEGREERPALHFFAEAKDYKKPTVVTYRELVGRIHQTANLLHRFGIGPKDVVTLLLPNLPQTHFAIWGGEAAGIVNPINPLLGVRAIAEIMYAAGSKVLIALGPVQGSDIWEKALEIRSMVPTLKTVFQVFGEGDPEQGIYSFDKLVSDCEASRLISGRRFAPDDPAAYFHTGGTTGNPKLASQSHFNQTFDAWAACLMGGTVGEETILCGLPLFHTNAIIVTGLCQLSQGGDIVLMTPQGYRDPEVINRFFDIAQHFKAASFSAVPTVYARLVQNSARKKRLPGFRYAFCGAAPMPARLFEAFEKQTGLPILEGYGLTEATCVSSVNPNAGERRIGSIGLRLPYQQMKVARLAIDGSVGEDCEPGESGVIVVKGPNVFLKYVQEPFNRDVWLPGGWFNTGDLGWQDAEGYFWITGRQRELIIRGGHNIDPAVIEEALHGHPAVALAAAVGRTDQDLGEVPVAFVVLKAGSRCSEEELLRHCQGEIEERAAVPKFVRILDELPMTPVGKVYKPALREMV